VASVSNTAETSTFGGEQWRLTWWMSQMRAVRSTEPEASLRPVQFHATECTW